MVIEEYDALQKILSEFRQEVNTIEEQIQRDMECIRDREASIQAFTDAEPEDFKVFSPRKMEAVHREEIERIRQEKSVCENRGRELKEKKEFLVKYIEKLEKILKCRKKDIIKGNEAERELQDTVIHDLDQLVHKIEQSSSQIVGNPVQAKQDFAVIGQSLKENVDKMRDTVWLI